MSFTSFIESFVTTETYFYQSTSTRWPSFPVTQVHYIVA